MFKIITLYTKHTPYEDEVEDWELCAKAIGVEYEIFAAESKGSWGRNTQLKARYILKALLDNPGKDIVWLDIDARIRQYPVFFVQTASDISCNVFSDHIEKDSLNSATVFFKSGIPAISLVRTWVTLNHEQVGRYGDQENLQIVLNEAIAADRIVWENLPQSYAKIFDRESHQWAEDVIVQYQASRRYKESVNG